MESSTAVTPQSRLSQVVPAQLRVSLKAQSSRITSRLRLKIGGAPRNTGDAALLGFDPSRLDNCSPGLAPAKTFSFGQPSAIQNRKSSTSEQHPLALKPYILPVGVLARRPKLNQTCSPLLGLPEMASLKPRRDSSMMDSRDEHQLGDSKIDIRLLAAKSNEDLKFLSIDTANFYNQQSSNKSGGILVTFGQQESLISPHLFAENPSQSLGKFLTFNHTEKSDLNLTLTRQNDFHDAKKSVPSGFSVSRRDRSLELRPSARSLLLFKRDRSASLEKCKGDQDTTSVDLGIKIKKAQEFPSKGSAKYLVSSHRIASKTSFLLSENSKSIKSPELRIH